MAIVDSATTQSALLRFGSPASEVFAYRAEKWDKTKRFLGPSEFNLLDELMQHTHRHLFFSQHHGFTLHHASSPAIGAEKPRFVSHSKPTLRLRNRPLLQSSSLLFWHDIVCIWTCVAENKNIVRLAAVDSKGKAQGLSLNMQQIKRSNKLWILEASLYLNYLTDHVSSFCRASWSSLPFASGDLVTQILPNQIPNKVCSVSSTRMICLGWFQRGPSDSWKKCSLCHNRHPAMFLRCFEYLAYKTVVSSSSRAQHGTCNHS